MNVIDVLGSAFRSILANKLRAGLTTLGIIIGVSSVVVLVAIGAGTQAQIREEIARAGTNVVVILPGRPLSSGTGSALAKALLTEKDAQVLREAGHGLEAVAPVVHGVTQVFGPNGGGNGTIFGVTEDYFIARDWQLSSGRFLVNEDVESAARVVMLGKTRSEQLFGNDDPVGQIIRVNRVPVEVIGLLGPKGRSMDGNDDDDIIIAPLTTAREQMLGRNAIQAKTVNLITAKVASSSLMDTAMTDISELLRYERRLQPGDPDYFRIQNVAEMLNLEQESSAALTRLLTAVASISLIVGGIGIMNTMLVSVSERRAEIGIRMAIGASPRSILVQFICEATMLSVLGGLAGALIGLAGAVLVENQLAMRVEVTLEPVILAFVFSSVVGLLSGTYPALKAAQLSPLTALRV